MRAAIAARRRSRKLVRRSRPLKVLLAALGFACATASVAAWPFAAGRPLGTLWVDFQDGLLSVEISDRPWREVLEEVSRKSGIRYRLYIDGEGRVTVSFKNLPVEQASRRLFGLDAALVFLYPPDRGSSTPSEIWMLGRGTVSPGWTGDDVASSGLTENDDLVEGARRAFDKNAEAAREAAVNASDRDVRRLAIAHLGQQGDREAVTLLVGLLQDPDDEIRQKAARALAGVADLREIVESDGKAWGRLAEVLQTVDDPEVRLLVSETLGIAAPEP